MQGLLERAGAGKRRSVSMREQDGKECSNRIVGAEEEVSSPQLTNELLITA